MPLKRLTRYVTWIVSGGLLIGTVGFLVLATPLVGNRALIIRSGSMTPNIRVGDVIVVRKQAGDYKAGDVIAYKQSDNIVVTHRIIDVTLRDGSSIYHTKGDANDAADEATIASSQIIGRKIAVIPWVGTLLGFAKTKVGFAALVILPALVVMVSELSVIVRELRRKKVTAMPRPAPVPEQHLPFSVSLIHTGVSGVLVDSISRRLIIFLAAMALMTQSTWALFADSGTSTNNIFTAASDFGIGLGDVVINEVMWMGSDISDDDEWVELRNMTSSSIDLNGWTITGAGAGSSSITLTGTIPANGFYLLSNFNSAGSAIAVTPDQVINDIALTNSGDPLQLKDTSTVIIDMTATPPPPWSAGINQNSPDLKQSMERKNVPGDGTVGANWQTCTHNDCNNDTYWDTHDGNNYGTPKNANSDTF